MARPPMPIGTWGKITRTQLAPGRWQALAKYRDYDGRTRRVKRTGPTGAAAERALTAALRDRATPTDSVTEITRDTTLADLAALWMVTRETEGKLSESTIEHYHSAINRYIGPGLGEVRVGEASVGRIDAFLRAIPGDAAAKTSRSILSGMFGLAARHDAIASNPVRDTTARIPARKPVRALTVDELQMLRRRVATWAGGNEVGPPRGIDVPEVFDVLAGTGGRIGEVLALRTEDLDLRADPPTATFAGTIDKHGARQPRVKTDSSYRTVVLPAFTVAALRRQIARDLPTDQDLVFPGRHGGPRRTGNVRLQLRTARSTIVRDAQGRPDGPAEMFDWVTPHVFRKTVATAVEGAVTIEAAAGQLGHASPEITRTHYVQRAARGPDLRHVLDGLGPVSDPLRTPDKKDGLPGDPGKAV